jgi:hypothetical protein
MFAYNIYKTMTAGRKVEESELQNASPMGA